MKDERTPEEKAFMKTWTPFAKNWVRDCDRSISAGESRLSSGATAWQC